MDSVSLVTTALAAGAAQLDEARASIKTSYARLKTLVFGRLGGDPKAEMVLAEYEREPEVWAAPLRAELARTGTDDDPDVVAAAQELMALLDTRGSKSGKYVVNVANAHGVQIGDNNSQVNRFND